MKTQTPTQTAACATPAYLNLSRAGLDARGEVEAIRAAAHEWPPCPLHGADMPQTPEGRGYLAAVVAALPGVFRAAFAETLAEGDEAYFAAAIGPERARAFFAALDWYPALVGALTHAQLRRFSHRCCSGLGPEASPRCVWLSQSSFGARHVIDVPDGAPWEVAEDHRWPENQYDGLDPARVPGARWFWRSCSGTWAVVVPRRGRGPSWQVYLWAPDRVDPEETTYARDLRAEGVALRRGTLTGEAARRLIEPVAGRV